MFNNFRKSETPLHLAIIANDEAEVLKLSDFFGNIPNALGFTPLEIAQFLGKSHFMEILGSPPIPKIPIFTKEKKWETLSSDFFYAKFKIHYHPFLKFENYEQMKEVIKNCPWILAKSWLGKENRELGERYRHLLTQGHVEANLMIKWINSQIGYGVFANEKILQGTWIGEYTGRIRRLYRSHPDQNAYCFHYPTRFWSLKYFAVDAFLEGNILRFINHSDHPNLEPKCLVDRGLLHQVFFAKEEIPKGSQLTFDYGKDFWAHRKKIELESFH